MNKDIVTVAESPDAGILRPVDIQPSQFPDRPSRGESPPATIDNVRFMLEANGIIARYNIIKKRTEFIVPWLVGLPERTEAAAMTHIQSLAARYLMPIGLVPALVEAIADENAYNPIATWIRSKPWDCTDRLPEICATITAHGDYPEQLKVTLITKWLLSAVAAALKPTGFRSRGVLTLQGPQGIGKTSWGLSLVDDPALRESVLKTDHHLDAGNKDSLLSAIDHWIVEIGELDSSFRRDVARLKGFLTAGTDKVRRPYGRTASEYPRRTVFYATVNAGDFLVDSTGNSRWWTIRVEAINHDHGIDMQQVFAQLAVMFDQGAQWWLTPEEEEELAAQNSLHRSFSLVRDKLMAIIDLTQAGQGVPYTASQILASAGFEHPSNQQARECGSLLREWFGEPKRINGRDKWRVVIREPEAPPPRTPAFDKFA